MQLSNDRARSGGGGPERAREHREVRPPVPEEPAGVRHDDPWFGALAPDWPGTEPPGAPAPAVPAPRQEPARDAMAEVYLAVQRSAAFQEVRSRYRRFVVPAGIGFFLWYVAYVVAATTAPGFMARPVVGAVNVALVAGLGQFLTTFVLAWAYARHARLRRDRAALDLRWDTQELTRGVKGGTS
ncbi:DUF485 domain-containing protein [Streptomyces roseirectus]|uniref:DUF485 domain-containing protein n=1 Tax=Streptomyces roseirectus TaxID=2768066 RepID=A0A7H0IAE2_9ACTN|nr:DUF485 domain-containing protein [Streptomyces roseirectus]QNP69758.1 DUF485 domain-containing protein [Streptomyces roseirectus]